MADFYQEMQDVATDLLTEFNQGNKSLVKITKGAGPVYDPGPDVPVLTTIQGTVSGVDKKYINGTSIIESDLMLITPIVSGLIPEMKDKIDLNGVQKEIQAIKTIPEVGIAVTRIIILR